MALAALLLSSAVTAQTTKRKSAYEKPPVSTDEFQVKKTSASSTAKSKTVTAPAPKKEELAKPKQQAVKEPQRVSTSYSRNPSFNTDYKTRGVSASLPDQLRGSGLNGKNIPIGAEDQYRKTLPTDYMPSDLVRIPEEWCYYKMPLYLRKEAAESLIRMFTDASCEGLRFYIFSGYRDFSHQQRLYNEAVRRDGPNQKSVAKPGRSEHALGTTADVTNGAQYLMKRSFETTPEGKWLIQNGSRYGWKMTVFSGSGKRSHSDEPWHIRYLGTGSTPAQQIADGTKSLPGKIMRAPAGLVNTIKKSVSKVAETLPLKGGWANKQAAPVNQR